MEETYLLNHPGVKKKILTGGTGPLPHFPTGTKLVFHFQTLLDNFERTVIDDSRLAKRPAEIFVGKMFKMEVWETLLTSMRVGEVAEFWCDAIHTGLYPIVSKGMRLIAQGRDPLEGQRHMCGMGNMFHYHSTGFPELDEIMRNPQPLIFIMELLQVGDPLSYKRESWMMEKDEKLEAVPTLHMQGNALVRQREFREAASKYKEAVLLLKTVQSREMPGDIDYVNLGRMIVPLELNYCQCMLELEEYYEVIEHATELLEKHKDCVKGYYKRAKAHAAVWNEKEARQDFNRVASLDTTLAGLIHRELKALSERVKEKYWEEKEKYWNMLENKEGQVEDEEEEDDEMMGEKKMVEVKEVSTGLAGENAVEACRAENVTAHKEQPKAEASHSETPPGISQSVPSQREEKDWQQMLRMVMFLKDEGNFLMKETHFEEASEKFKEAIEYINILQYKKVDQKSEDWESLEKVRLPLTLNLSQCMLELHQYQQVVELNNKLLTTHKGNLKAVYQRARAHSALCHEDEARRDFVKVERLDPKFKPIVRQELKILGEHVRAMHTGQKKTYRDTTQEKWGPGGTRAKATAGKKSVTFAQKAGAAEVTEHIDKEQRSVEKLATAKEEVREAAREEKGPDVKMEAESTKEKGSEGGREGGYGCGAPDNGVEEEDSGPAPTSTVKDNVESKRSGADTGKGKVKCQSAATQSDPGGAVEDNTGNGAEPTNKSKLFAANQKVGGERDGEWSEEGGIRDGSNGTEGKSCAKQPTEAAGEDMPLICGRKY